MCVLQSTTTLDSKILSSERNSVQLETDGTHDPKAAPEQRTLRLQLLDLRGVLLRGHPEARAAPGHPEASGGEASKIYDALINPEFRQAVP